ncbi:acyl carrier protein [Micromonospora sp. KLBMP9576]|uniref:acyl carrier protein n=1 Tax=Micromonospora sp. KLBMP9576 TaxID=3424769 RepID=UPI003D8DBFE2
MSATGDRVVAAVADVLGVPAAEVRTAATLFDLPGFDSIAVVGVLERLESDLGVEVPPERIVPEAFATVDDVARLVDDATALVPGRPMGDPR